MIRTASTLGEISTTERAAGCLPSGAGRGLKQQYAEIWRDVEDWLRRNEGRTKGEAFAAIGAKINLAPGSVATYYAKANKVLVGTVGIGGAPREAVDDAPRSCAAVVEKVPDFEIRPKLPPHVERAYQRLTGEEPPAAEPVPAPLPRDEDAPAPAPKRLAHPIGVALVEVMGAIETLKSVAAQRRVLRAALELIGEGER